MSRYALTPDITIRGRMPTPLEYKEHMRLLEDVDTGGRRLFDHWTGKDMTDIQHEVWVAVHRQGLVKQDRDGNHRLTPYGKVYLSQRRASEAAFRGRDASRRAPCSRACQHESCKTRGGKKRYARASTRRPR